MASWGEAFILPVGCWDMYQGHPAPAPALAQPLLSGLGLIKPFPERWLAVGNSHKPCVQHSVA